MSLTKTIIAEQLKQIQQEICAALETADGKATFSQEPWERPGGGGGLTRVMQHGAVIEKGGVNFSAVHGKLPAPMVQALQVNNDDFFAAGVSIVMHPESPMVPIIHMNVRYFELGDGTWWFGGGIDLTPHYVDEQDARWFHGQLKAVCDRFSPGYYRAFKVWADQYFYIPHRKESRGVGGIFFDRLGPETDTKENLFAYIVAVAKSFAPIYTSLIQSKRNLSYGETQKNWQYLRRGRYVEFNLVYDKGTKFGLETDGRIESILMSLPEKAGWIYNFQPDSGSEESKTLDYLRSRIDWIG